MAVVVWRVAPHRPVNRLLAALLVLEGIGVTTCSSGLDIFLTDPDQFYATQILNMSVTLALPIVYLLFLGFAVDSPLARPFRSRTALVAAAIALPALQLLWILHPERFVTGLTVPRYATWAATFGPWGLWALRVYALAGAFGVVVALDAYRRAPSHAHKRRAGAYAAAFVVRDLWWILVFFILMPYTAFYTDPFWSVVWTQVTPSAILLFMALLAYGILRTHLFDIDLKIKSTVKYSTVAAAFFVAFFAVSEGVEALVSREAGTWAGLGAALLLALGVRPLERGAARVADRVMPGVEPTPSYLERRKHSVYRAALEAAIEDGAITRRDRGILDRLRSELDLDPSEARTLEAEVLGTLPHAG